LAEHQSILKVPVCRAADLTLTGKYHFCSGNAQINQNNQKILLKQQPGLGWIALARLSATKVSCFDGNREEH
jgi:hypothetical protein